MALKIKFPENPTLKRLAVTRNNDIMPLLMNDVDMDKVFTLFMERCVRRGTVSMGRDKKEFEPDQDYNLETRLIPSLSVSPDFKNFDSDVAREALLNWSKASIFNYTTIGKTKKGEQIDTMKLLSIASYRAALPKRDNRSSARGVDEAIYQALFRYVASLPGCEKPGHEIHLRIAKTSLAQGVDFNENGWPWPEPKYNNIDDVDINTLLQLRIIEKFSPIRVDDRPAKKKGLATEPLGIYLMSEVARDSFAIIEHFGDKSAPELLIMLRSIFALHLYRLPIRLSRSLNPVLGNEELEDSLMFFDFTQQKNSASVNLSKNSVADDLAIASTLVQKQIYIGAILDYIKQKPALLAEYLEVSEEDRLSYLQDIALSDAMERHAYGVIQELIETVESSSDEAEKSELLFHIEKASSLTNFEQLVKIVLLEIQDPALEALKKWLKAVAGVKNTTWSDVVSVVSGQQKSPDLWHYGMSDAVLNTLLDLSFIDENGHKKHRKELSLQEVFDTFRSRWGIVINTSLPKYDSAEFDQAASENTLAFKSRIKQMGWFAALSDDENAQYIAKPEGA